MFLVVCHASLMALGVFMFKDTGDNGALLMALMNAVFFGAALTFEGIKHLVEKQKELANEQSNITGRFNGDMSSRKREQDGRD